MSKNPFFPFRGPHLPERVFAFGPLVAAISQVTFPTALAVENEGLVAEFQKRVKDRFPVLTRGNRVEVDNGAMRNRTVWNFHTQHGDWVLSLCGEFIGLNCGTLPDAAGNPHCSYAGKADFVSRMGDAFAAAAETFGIDQAARLGVRHLYHAPISLQSNYVSDFINPDLLISSAAGVGGHHIRSTASGHTDEGFANVSWGTVLPGTAADLGGFTVGPNPGDSWFIDIDSYAALGSPTPMTPQLVRASLEGLASRAHDLFQWVASPAMLKRLETPKAEETRVVPVARQLH